MLGAAMRAGLMQDGYAVDWVRDGMAFDAAIKSHQYDCLLLDLGLPDTSGDELLRALRTAQAGIPVIVITARAEIENRIKLLDLGADDYLVKPVDLDELSARIRAIMRRGVPPETEVLTTGCMKIDFGAHQVTVNDTPVKLTRKEFWLLETLIRNRTRVMSRQQLEQAVYGWGDEVESNAVEVHIYHLRKKMGIPVIRTVRGVGYQFSDELS